MKRSFLILVLLVSGATQARAQITYNLNTLNDTRILGIVPNQVAYNDGYLSVLNQGNNVQRSLLKFDLTGITNVTAATLTLTVRPELPGNGSKAFAFRLTKDFTASQATWNSASAGNPWATPGGDFTGNPGSVDYGNTIPTTGKTNFDVTTLVQQWTNGTFSNFGFLLNGEVGSSAHFFTHLDQANQPVLTIRSSTLSTPEPSSVAILSSLVMTGGVFAVRRRRRK